jgi:phosphoglycerol geranylgeranyltransferase
MKILEILQQRRLQGKKSIAVLIDPDKADDPGKLKHLIHLASENCVDFFFVGGSLITTPNLSEVIQSIKEDVNIPVILFPGSSVQIDPAADGVLFLSLISGRNPDLRNYKMEVLPTGYMLISSGRTTSVAYISNTTPIPEDKYSLAACTAMAGEMLGLQLIYLDAGSGAEREISPRMISTVRKAVNTPVIVGGGINTAAKALHAFEAGADLIVIGNVLEKNPETLNEISDKVYDWNQTIEARK